METTIGTYLLTRLKEIGVRHIIGVPGDFNLQFLEQIEDVEGIEFIGTCNELNAAYAADGYARLKGIAAIVTTYGVGELSAICGVAGACAEHVPVVCITGAPPLHAMEQRKLIHHTLADGNFENMMTCYRQFTAAQTRLTPSNAPKEIDRVLVSCLREKRPVYIQLPSDISYNTVSAPERPLDLDAASDPASLNMAVEHMARMWTQAERPAILVDGDADRFGMTDALKSLVEKTQVPYASMTTGKCILDETHSMWLGMYSGGASAPAVKDGIEGADCLIATAPRFSDGNSALFSQSLPAAATVVVEDGRVSIEGQQYEGVRASEFLMRLAEVVAPAEKAIALPRNDIDWTVSADSPLAQARLWPRLARFVKPNDVVVTEVGTSHLALGQQTLPAGVTYISANTWGAIGFSLPAVLGTCLADPNRRHLLFIGDGSLQVTVQELSTILRNDVKPVIFLLNNRGYTIERFILGMESAYNDVANWKYTELSFVFSDTSNYFAVQVKTEGELEAALEQAEACKVLTLIEMHLDPFDAPESLKNFGPAVANFDYGVRAMEVLASK